MLVRTTFSALLILATLLAGRGHAQAWPLPPGERAAIREFRDVLEAEVTQALGLPFPARVSLLHMYEVRYEWEIEIEAVVADHLDQLGIEPKDDRTLQFAAWADSINDRLIEVSRQIIGEAGIDPLYTPEVDHQLRIWGLVRAPVSPPPPRRESIAGIAPYPNEEDRRHWGERYAAVTFLGHRCTSVYDGRERLEPQAPADGVARFMTSIELDAAEIPFRSSITGRITVTNTGECRLPIGYHDLRIAPVVHTPAGERAEFKAFLGPGHPPRPDWWDRPLLPGESYTEPFVIATDPTQDDLSYRLPPGEYAVSAEFRLSPLSSIPNQIEPAIFRVAGEPGAYHGPRARRVLALGDRLLVFREDAWIEAIDPLSGERLGILRTIGYPESLWGDTSIAFSSDGLRLALGSRREDPVSIHSLDGNPAVSIPMTGDRRPIHDNGDNTALGFGPGRHAAYFGSDRGIIAFDARTGEEVWRSPLNLYGPRLSPDGRYIVTAFDPQGRFADGQSESWHSRGPFANPGAAGRTVFTILSTQPGSTPMVRRVPDRGDEPYVTLGLNGLYGVHAMHEGVTYVPYEAGEVRILGSGAIAVDSESPDGTLVVLRRPGGPTTDSHDGIPSGPTTLEVWDVAAGGLLYSIEDGRVVSGRFVGRPPVLVLLEYHEDKNGAYWLREAVELRDARTGEFLRRVDITPQGFPDLPDPWGEPEEMDEDG